MSGELRLVNSALLGAAVDYRLRAVRQTMKKELVRIVENTH
ncbi:hypothetical protein [Paracoccus rhizosphaerae]|uniref:Uncharacterized protein n=1 Tax=Paracoccus rhizosphaerae TaxID=1133347 RepID=A0ABV6CM50_9RHOB|nr:hypothetical protein [Paracoccus rhizosphaerae]